jgi:hypothetical protein
MKNSLLAALLMLPISIHAQQEQARSSELSYTYAELRYLDTDGGGDGLRLRGSYQLSDGWLIVGGLTSVDYSGRVDGTTVEIGAGYVYNFDDDFDFVATLQFLNTEIDTPFGSADDNGFALSAGARGKLTDEFEIRGSVNHINVDNNDTFIELAGDYYFSDSFSLGASLEVAGDDDVFSIGARFYFR